MTVEDTSDVGGKIKDSQVRAGLKPDTAMVVVPGAVQTFLLSDTIGKLSSRTVEGTLPSFISSGEAVAADIAVDVDEEAAIDAAEGKAVSYIEVRGEDLTVSGEG